MMGNEVSLIADAAVAALLVVVIGYAMLLSRRLRAWRAEAGDMERQVVALNTALNRAAVAIDTLKAANRDDAATLEAVQKKAQSLRADLSFLVERGTTLADRLEQSVRGGLNAQGHAGPAAAMGDMARPANRTPGSASPGSSDRSMSSAERELLKALEAMR
jgi:hypothetical protein